MTKAFKYEEIPSLVGLVLLHELPYSTSTSISHTSFLQRPQIVTMRASFLTAIAALTASAVSTPISVGEVYAFINGAKFRLNVPAGYADGAPTFDGKFQSQS